MKKSNLVLFPFLFLIFGCNNSNKKATNFGLSDTTKTSNSMVLPDDTVTIMIDTSTRITYKWGMLKKILKDYPVLNPKTIISPDEAYTKALSETKAPNDSDISFKSEIGKDSFFDLYDYYLKKKLTADKYQIQRRTFIRLYKSINKIFSNLANGGTYFIHMDSKIPGYAEYSVYLNKDSANYDTDYLSKQKMLYTDSLKQLIVNKISTDNYSSDKQKNELKKKLFERVNDINGLITNNFYLKRAQVFEYSYYKN
jgi:hypothetical protein